MKKMFTLVFGRCPISGVETIECRELSAPDWSLYVDNMNFRRKKNNNNKTITQVVNRCQNALKTQNNRG
jgi:hypothetical protein